MKEIRLAHGQIANVDDEDFATASQWKWHLSCRGYAIRSIHVNKKVQKVFMHHDIIGRPMPGMETDHINRNRLDNRRTNLRHCTSSLNKYNREIPSDNTLGFKGIKLRCDGRYYSARLNVDGKRITLGSFFKTPEDAAKAYNDAALNHYGEFALLNEIPAEEAA